MDITRMQTGYVADRDDCRASSESNAGSYSEAGANPLSDKEKNAALLQLFCECMKDKPQGWKVAGCPKHTCSASVCRTTACHACGAGREKEKTRMRAGYRNQLHRICW